MTADLKLFDTDVLVDHLRGRPETPDLLHGARETLCVSTITVVELYAGVREGAERTAMDAFLDSIRVVPLTEDIARMAGLFQRDFGKSHHVETGDAVIAATAAHLGAKLQTLNTKHYPMFKNLQPPYRK